MKRNNQILSALLAVLLVFSLAGCAKQSVAGGWAEDAVEMTEESQDVFDKAVAGTEYEGYTVCALLGTQVVAGTNYKFLCETPDGVQKVLVIYRDLDKNCSVTSVEDPA